MGPPSLLLTVVVAGAVAVIAIGRVVVAAIARPVALLVAVALVPVVALALIPTLTLTSTSTATSAASVPSVAVSTAPRAILLLLIDFFGLGHLDLTLKAKRTVVRPVGQTQGSDCTKIFTATNIRSGPSAQKQNMLVWEVTFELNKAHGIPTKTTGLPAENASHRMHLRWASQPQGNSMSNGGRQLGQLQPRGAEDRLGAGITPWSYWARGSDKTSQMRGLRQ